MSEKPSGIEIVEVLLSTIANLSKAPMKEIKVFGMNRDELLDYIRTGVPVRDPSSQPKGGWWIHKKTGHRYEIVTFALIEATLEPSVVYRSEKDQVWVRPAHEFFDGRFQQEQK